MYHNLGFRVLGGVNIDRNHYNPKFPVVVSIFFSVPYYRGIDEDCIGIIIGTHSPPVFLKHQ